VDPRFGRCSTFLLVETGDRSFEVHDNIPSTLGGGAGIQSASALAHLGVKAVLTGSCGPNAHETLTASDPAAQTLPTRSKNLRRDTPP
jgi:predicted Fe-Mo cluster-binding NifX family protein